MKEKKIAVIGSGHVGATTALYLAQKELAKVVLVDIVEGLPQGLGLDMFQASPVQGFDCDFKGTTNLSLIESSNIVIITAGLARTPGMDRLDLLKKNASILASITNDIVKYAPEAIIVVVSNPVDVMSYLVYKASQFTKNRVIGMAGVLDSARLAAFIALELGVSVKDISPMVLGGHGDNMIPLARYTTVSGIPITELMSKNKIDQIIKRTQTGGAEIVGLLKTGSAYYAPGASVVAMVESILKGQRRIMPSSCYLEGEYGVNDIYIGVPAKLGVEGIEDIIELSLFDNEAKAMKKNAEAYKKSIAELRKVKEFSFL